MQPLCFSGTFTGEMHGNEAEKETIPEQRGESHLAHRSLKFPTQGQGSFWVDPSFLHLLQTPEPPGYFCWDKACTQGRRFPTATLRMTCMQKHKKDSSEYRGRTVCKAVWTAGKARKSPLHWASSGQPVSMAPLPV